MRNFLMLLIIVTELLLWGCAAKKTETLNEQLATKPDTAKVTPPPATSTQPQIDAEKLKAEQLRRDTEEALRNIYFGYNLWDLAEESRTTLSGIAKFLETYPEIKLKIEGHCDERGSSEYNMALGQKRADAAKDYLVSYGVSRTRMSTMSWGEERPADTGHDETAWAKNRRDEFTREN